MTRRWSIFGLSISMALARCSRPAPGHEADSRALRDGEVAAFVKDWGSKDAGRMAAHYTEDGNVIIPNAPVMTGQDAIGKGMKEALSETDLPPPVWRRQPAPLAALD